MMQSPSAGLGVDGAPKVTGATVAAPLVQAVLFHTHLDAQVTFVEEDSSRWTEPKVLVLGVAAENKPFIVIRNIAASDDDSALIVDDNLWKQLIISQKNAMEARLELKRSLKLGGKKARELIFTSLAGAEEDFDLAFRRVQLAANSGKTGASAPSIGIDIDATANATAQLSLRAEKPELRKALKKQVGCACRIGADVNAMTAPACSEFGCEAKLSRSCPAPFGRPSPTTLTRTLLESWRPCLHSAAGRVRATLREAGGCALRADFVSGTRQGYSECFQAVSACAHGPGFSLLPLPC